MSNPPEHNPYQPPRADLDAGKDAKQPGSPIKAVLVGVIFCLVVQIIAGVALYVVTGTSLTSDPQAHLPPWAYALNVVFSVGINLESGRQTASIANAREYWWAGIAGAVVLALMLAMNASSERSMDGFEVVLDVLDSVLTIPAFLVGAWFKLRRGNR